MLPTGYTLRDPRPDELPALPPIEAAAATLHGELGAMARTTPVAELAEALAHGRLIAAFHDDQPVGFACYGARGDDLYVDEVDVAPAHGRRGVGAALMRALIARARAEGAARLTLSTMRDVRFNAPFYAKLGFVELTEDQLTPALRAVRAAEAARGLPLERRVLMGLDLTR